MPRESLLGKAFSGLRSKLNGSGHDKEKIQLPEIPDLRMLCFIVDWNKANLIANVFAEEKVRFHFIAKGKGTASSEILHLLGIGAGDKAIIFCLEQAVLVPVLMKEARRKIVSRNPGQGIAFSIPLSAINDPVLRAFTHSVFMNEKIPPESLSNSGKPSQTGPAENGENMANETQAVNAQPKTAHPPITNDLIVSIVNQGYSDALMNTARAAGAHGGTVISSRGQTHEGVVKFFGVSVQDEKEIIFILTARDKKTAIMQAVCESHGLNSEAHGIVFSLPVDNVMGLSYE